MCETAFHDGWENTVAGIRQPDAVGDIEGAVWGARCVMAAVPLRSRRRGQHVDKRRLMPTQYGLHG